MSNHVDENEDLVMYNDNDDDDDNDNDELEIITAPDIMYMTPTYFHQTRKRGKILKNVSERYLRDDLGFGCYYIDDDEKKGGMLLSGTRRQHVDKVLGKPKTIDNVQQLLSLLQPCKPHAIVVCDTNVLLHNLDLLEYAVSCNVMPNIIIPQTAITECRSNQMVAYDRTVELLRSVGANNNQQKQQQRRCCIFFPDPYHVATAIINDDESNNNNNNKTTTINDENDQRIRNVATYYAEQLKNSNVRVVLLTDDVESRNMVSQQQQNNNNYYEAHSVRSWVQQLEQHNPDVALQDLVAQFGSTSTSKVVGSATALVNLSEEQKEAQFSPHLDVSILSKGVKAGRYHRGVFRSRDRNNGMVTIRRGEERVAVSILGGIDRNRAVDGDVVAIALHPLDKWMKSTINVTDTSKNKKEEEAGIADETAEPTLSDVNNVPESITLDDTSSWRPTGKVVGVIRRNFGSYSGSIYETKIEKDSSEITEREKIAKMFEREHQDGTFTCVFFPVDKKVPPILIRTTQRDRLLGQRIVVSMDSWPAYSPYPLGHYVRTIGVAGTKDVETQVLLHQHNIPHEPFPAAVLACLPPEDYKIDADNSPGREDLRHLPVLSIDPPGCKDIDDALHCIELPNGNWQAGVHIADVTHYVQAGTAIDVEAANRSTSTYLVNKRLDMLPGLLTTDLCSLKGNVDRYAFSVLWEVTPEAEIIKVDFKKTLIHSIAALTYQQAQSYIDQQEDPSDIQACAVKRLAALAKKFRKRRIDAGALTLASPEVKFVLDSESLNPTDVQAYALLEANAVVEEFMLLANVTVSKKILRHYPTLSVLRRHPAPNRAMFDSLISKARSKNLRIDIEDSKRLADSLDAAQVESDPYINKLLRILSTRCMSPAQYFCSGEFRPQEWHHYGLAAPVYTHFTSPIRRYADVCVHRLLAAAIGVAPLPQHLSSKSYLHDLTANMNRRHRSAQLAGRASVQLHTLIFFSKEGGKEEDAYVLDVETAESSDPSFTVIVPRYGIEGRVKLGIDASDPRIQRFADQHKLIYTSDDKVASVQVFDKVKVRILVKEIQDHQRELVLELLQPDFGVATIDQEADINRKRSTSFSENRSNSKRAKVV